MSDRRCVIATSHPRSMPVRADTPHGVVLAVYLGAGAEVTLWLTPEEADAVAVQLAASAAAARAGVWERGERPVVVLGSVSPADPTPR